MDVDQQIHHWFSSAQHDIDTAYVLLEEGRSFDCMRACHECLQKVLKGIWVMRRKEHPPTTDNLLWLARELGVNFRDPDLDLVADLIVVRQTSAWADEGKALRRSLPREKATRAHEQTEELIHWLKDTYFE